MQEKIIQIIIKALQDLTEVPQNENSKIYGADGCLDSLGLVNLISDLEELIHTEFNKEIILADEKIMSVKNTPFKDVKSLANYIEKALKD